MGRYDIDGLGGQSHYREQLMMPKKIAAFLTSLFGKFSWTAPAWATTVKPRKFWAITLTTLIAIAALFSAYCWYQSLPQPERILAKITTPNLTPIDKILVPDNLIINFGIPANDELNPRSVAPINLIGKEVTQGITITPAIQGKWFWDTDSRLMFIPKTDWPANQTYTIHFDKDSLTAGTKMASWDPSFTTQPFTATINEFKFYQDPLNPAVKQAVATIEFSYPVDTDSLTSHVNLQWQGSGNPDFKYTITYDENKRTAYIHSETIDLPSSERFLVLTLTKGIKSGSAKLVENVSSKILVPDAASYFKITNSATEIVRNPQGRPEQVLTLETTLATTENDLTKALHVYLLPQDYPETSAEQAKPDYQWQDVGEVTEKVLALSTPVTLEAIPTERDYATLHSYKYHSAKPSYIYVKIDKGVRGLGNFDLANNYAAILKVPAYPQEIAFLHKGALLALGTEEKLSVLVRGLGAVKFNFARVLPDNVNHLITQTNGDFSNPYFIDPNFNQDNISEIFSQTQSFDATDPGKEQYTALDLSQYLKAKANKNGPLGLFLLQARGWDNAKNLPLDTQASRLVLITDLGLIVKDNLDATHDVFVQSITQGTPVKNAAVAILGKNGVPLLTRTTDDNGHAAFPSLKDFTQDREPVVYIVMNGSDVSFIPYYRYDRQLNYSRYDVGGMTSNSENPAALTAYIFSDRGIYRPGDTAHFGLIVKQPYVMPQTAGLPLQATVVDPRGVTVKDVKLTLNDSGYLSLDFQTNATSPTGQYQVYLYIVKDNHASTAIGSTSIRVAEFLPDRMRISAHLSQTSPLGWISPKDLSASVDLWNLYGAPAADHRIGGRLLLTPKAVTFDQFPDYTFIDPLLDPKAPPKVFTDTLTETKTDDKGHAVFDLKLNRFEKATYQLTVFVEGFEAEGGRSVTAQTKALVSPLAYFVGYKADGDLSYIKQNTQRSVNFIAVNPSLTKQNLSDLKLQVFSQRPVSTLVKKDDGTYQYQSIIQTSQISSSAFNIAEQGTNYTLPTDAIGDFLIAIIDKDGTELSHFKYSVVGNSQQPLSKNAELSVKLNKTEFNAGEDIEMQITAPYTGAGLITIERDKVYATQWFKTDSTSSVQKIHVPEDFQGNGYVNIAFVRDLNSSEIFMSPLSYSVVPFTVTHEKHDMHIDLTIPKTSRPGESFPITYKTDKPGKIIVFAVDEGILQVAHYQTPNPLQFFFQKHALEVNTMQIVDQILPKFIAERELSAVGGDDGEAMLRSNLNPFKRKTDAPVVYWSDILDTDTTPHQLNYQVPDYFNGSLRVMAVAVAADAVGATSQTAEIRGHFVISPNVPTFVAPGDEFDVTASIANNVEGSGSSASINVELSSAPSLEIIGSSKQTLVVPQGQERSVHFKVRAKKELGSADLAFTAALGDKSSKISSSLSIRPAVPFSTSVTSGYTSDAKQTTPLNHVFYPAYRQVQAAMSTSPLILVTGMQNYLNDYPYGCVEQLVSKAFPWLAMINQPWFATDKQVINEKIQQTIQMLSQRQMSSGGFNYWPEVGSTQSNDFASVYAMHFLTEAKAQGYSVPADVFSAGIGYLKDLAVQDSASLEQARIHAYAIYILTRNEIITSNYLTNLQLSLDNHPEYKWHDDIISAYIAATYQLLKSATTAEKIIGYYKPAQSINAGTDFYNQNTANAQYLYLLALHFPDRLQKLDNQLVMSLVNALNDNSITTILSGYTSLALSAYNQHLSPSADAASSISVTSADNKETTLATTNGMYRITQIGLNAKAVTFNNPAKQAYFYQLTEAGFDQSLPTQAINQGMEVFREFRGADNKVVNSFKLGDEATVYIHIRSTDNQYRNNIALVDLLPGGFEVVKDSIQLTNMDYVDVREDRVIFFGGVGPDSKEIIYRVKATSAGKFIVPPMFAAAMYNPMIKAVGVSGSVSVN